MLSTIIAEVIKKSSYQADETLKIRNIPTYEEDLVSHGRIPTTTLLHRMPTRRVDVLLKHEVVEIRHMVSLVVDTLELGLP